MDIIELLTPAYEAAWLPWAVQYFFLIGIAATAALLAAWLAFGNAGSDRARLLPAVVTVLVVTAIAAPVSLLADLHQPGRFWHFYAHPTPWSWMSLGAFLLPVFVVLSLAFAGLWWLRKPGLLRLVGVLLALIWRPLPGGMGAGYALLLALAMLVAAWVFRWIVFMAVQTVPKFGAGLYLQGISWGGDGVLGMVGVFGLVAALIAIVTWGLFRFPPRADAALA